MGFDNRPRAAIFDVEGTLVDCVPLILESWRETLQEAGYSFSHNDLQRYSGMDGGWMLEKLLPEEEETTREGLLKLQGERYREAFIKRAQPVPRVRDLFEALKRAGIAIGIATTCKGDELESYDRQLRVLDLTDAVACGDMVQHGKPDPGLFQQVLRKLHISDAAGCIAIGDTPFDALAASAAKMRAAGVLTGGFSRSALLDAGCEEAFDQVHQVQRLWHPDGSS